MQSIVELEGNNIVFFLYFAQIQSSIGFQALQLPRPMPALRALPPKANRFFDTMH
jgi:hypothetical protein